MTDAVPQPTSAPETQSAAAGWYPEQNGQTQRYWDGYQWTEHAAPLSGVPAADEGPTATKGDWIGGVILALVIPIVGIIAGIVYVARGGPRAQCGWTVIILSVVSAGIGFALLSAQ